MRVTDRIRALHDAGDVDSARQLAREVVRNRSDVAVSLADGELVVSVPGFTGRHPVSARPDSTAGDQAVVYVDRGAYRLDDGPSFDVTVHSLWDDAEDAAVPVLYSAVREDGFETLHTVQYAAGRSEVRYREDTEPESRSAADESTAAAGTESGVLRSVRQLIR